MSVLYVKEHGASIGVVNERVQIRRKQKVVEEIPVLHLERIVLMVPTYITLPAVKFLMDRGIPIAYLSQNGKFYGQFSRGNGADVNKRLAQFRKFYDRSFRLRLARVFIEGKIGNMIELWQRQRRHGDLRVKVDRLEKLRDKASAATSLESLRGFEGSATAQHFSLLRKGLKGEWKFDRRIHNPPPDPANAMLSLGYTLLYSRMSGLLQVHGLDPYLGFFHEPKHGHAALASDMIEEWRPVIVDTLMLRLINTNQIKPTDFNKGSGQCKMKRELLQLFVNAFEERLQSFSSNSNETSDPVGGLVGQIRQLSRVLLGQQKRYQPINMSE